MILSKTAFSKSAVSNPVRKGIRFIFPEPNFYTCMYWNGYTLPRSILMYCKHFIVQTRFSRKSLTWWRSYLCFMPLFFLFKLLYIGMAGLMKNGNERREAGLRNQLPLIPVVQTMVNGDQGIWAHVKAFFWLDTLTIMGYINDSDRYSSSSHTRLCLRK